MQFARPGYFGLFGILPAAVLFYLLMFRRRRLLLERFADPTLLQQLLSGVSLPKQRLKPCFILFALAFLILALAEPQWGFQIEEVKRRGVDLVIALDLSKSMLAQDVKPNRLERSRLEIESLLNTLRGDRVGLVGFAGEAFLQCPLTLDYATAKLFLKDLDVRSIPVGGTDLGGAIHQAVSAFEGQEGGERVILLITDGEDHGRRLERVLEEAKKQRAVIYPIGIGRRGGAPIPVAEEDGQRHYLRSREGDIIISKPNWTLLERIAATTGGKVGAIGSGKNSLEDIYVQEIAKREKRELASQQKRQYHHRFQWPLALGIFFLYLEGLVSERLSISRIKQWPLFLILFAFLCGFNWGGATGKVEKGNRLWKEGKYEEALQHYSEAQADRPNAPEIPFNMGDGFYRQKQYAEAIGAHTRSIQLDSGPLKEKGAYNIGNSLFRQGNLEGALTAYQKALDLNPGDVDAKYNIEFIRRQLQEQQKKKQQSQPQNKQEQKREEQNQQGKGTEGQDQTGQPLKQEKSQEQTKEQKPASALEKMSPKDAQRLLNALQTEEKNLPMRPENREARPVEVPVDKDW